jgi:hypothetical protein
MLILSILHNLFLNKKELENLKTNREIEIIGISLPVYFYEGDSSEPAEEVFCKYKIILDSEEDSILTTKYGYVINIPNKNKFNFNSANFSENGITYSKTYDKKINKMNTKLFHVINIFNFDKYENSYI